MDDAIFSEYIIFMQRVEQFMRHCMQFSYTNRVVHKLSETTGNFHLSSILFQFFSRSEPTQDEILMEIHSTILWIYRAVLELNDSFIWMALQIFFVFQIALTAWLHSWWFFLALFHRYDERQRARLHDLRSQNALNLITFSNIQR